ncbi:MAG: T9SS type A sorting domain-containing protein [Fluviicola sp.]|nr:T9SS type A sorting domain-containing protein [Fluviicola sp.]
MKRIFQVLSGIMLSFSALAQFQGNALQFDGANDNVSATLPALFNNLSTTDFTMEAWVYPQGAVFSRIIYAQGSTTNFATMSTGGTNNIYFYVVENGTNYSIATSVNLPSNTWTHVTARWTTATNSAEVFYNGVLQAGINGGSSSTGSLNNLSIGTRPGGAQYFPGTLDEVRIWSEARSNCEIQANYNRSMTGTEPNLVVNYNFNQGVAAGNNAGVNTLPDLVAGNNGTLNNFTLNGTTSNWIASTATINASSEVAAVTSTTSISACSSYLWTPTNQTYTTSGQYMDTLTTVGGCDSIVVLNLTINQPTSSSISIATCDTYMWSENGMNYTTSGTYYDTLVNAMGCDSIIALNLTINLPTTSSLTASACESYLWVENGMTYTTSGSYNDTIPNAAGCDSIITLNLTINQSTSSNLTEIACGSYSWAQNGVSYMVSGSYNDTIPNANGCDSIITLNLTVNPITSSSETVSACDSYTWNANGVTYTTSGQHSHAFLSVAGCDSMVTLNLTVVPTPTANATDDGLGTLTGSGGNTVQWINCGTNTAIAGATSTTFSPIVNGSYAIVVVNGNCDDTSNCVVVNYIGLNENQTIDADMYPNPTTSEVTIIFEGLSAVISIREAHGKIVHTQSVQSGEAISLEKMQSGVYFFELTTELGKTVKRVVKQ